jgi:peptidoglycan hydrolase-like protein with peptidoglycan-binding domain
MPKAMLARGASGTAVEALQRALIALGVNPGPADGLFGPKTEAAVKRFQKKSGLVDDGIAGPKTLAALEAAKKAAAAPPKPIAKPIVKPAPKPVAKPAPKPVVKPAPKPAAKPAGPVTGMAGKLAAVKPAPKKP